MSLSPFLHPFAPPAAPGDSFIPITRGEGAVVYDAGGKAYVDGMGSLWYANIGHGRAEVAEAVAAQLRKVVYHTFSPFTNEPAELLAARLRDLAPFPEGRTFFTSSGSEAVDSALKIARVAQRQAGHPERTVVISRDRSYHGVAYGGTSVQGIPVNRDGFGPLIPDTLILPADDLEALRSAFAGHGGRIAAFITEPVQGAGGVFPPPAGYLEEARRLCDETGAYLIFDEVICAFGRLGTWFGAQFFGVRPDLVIFAKAITSGYVPLGGVILGTKVRSALEADPAFWLRHGFTYSGHPAACAAGLVCLEITEREGLLERAVAIGERLEWGLTSLAAEGLVGEARGAVAMWAVRLHEHQDATELRNRMLGLGAIARPLPGNTLSYCPPLVATDDQVDHLVEALRRVVG